MKIVQRKLALNRSGWVKIIIEEQDDLWVVYNLIAKGDIIVMDTTRKVTKQKKNTPDAEDRKQNKIRSKTNDSCRVKFKLELQATEVDYEKDSSVVRVRGKSLVDNEVIRVGAYHTLEIERNKEFDLKKDLWDSKAIDTLHESSDQTSGADLAVIILQPGSGQLYFVGQKKRVQSANITGSKKLHEGVFHAFVKHVDFNTVRCVLIGSSGSLKQEFRGYLFQEAKRLKMKAIEDNKSRFVMVDIGNKSSLKEVLHDEEVIKVTKDAKAVMEIRAYKEFSDLLSANSDRVCYGPKSVENANEMMAIETLLITDDLLRSNDIALRKKNMELVKSVKKAGGKAVVFSPMHVSGDHDQLERLAGIAAVLRFPLPNLDELVI